MVTMYWGTGNDVHSTIIISHVVYSRSLTLARFWPRYILVRLSGIIQLANTYVNILFVWASYLTCAFWLVKKRKKEWFAH